MARRIIRKTDLGTIVLHWLLVVLLLIAVGTGLRIAIGSSYDMSWLEKVGWLLPQKTVWTWHIPAGVLLFALSVSYAIYLYKANLFRRIQPDLARLSGIAGRRKARLGALNIILYWVFFLSIILELITGVMLYVGHAGFVTDLHLLGTWILISYVPAHLLMHLAIGGLPQLLRIFNPGKLAPPPPPFDPYELLAEVVEQKNRKEPEPPVSDKPVAPRRPEAAQRARLPGPDRRGSGGVTLRAHPLVVAIAGGLATVMFLMSLDQATRDVLVIEEVQDEARKPVIDGDVSDPIWRSAVPVRVRTQQGGNLDGEGGATVEIRAIHDGTYVYLSFVWDDPTRSLKHLPLEKTASGWRVMHDRFDHGDANAFYEDKFSVLLTPGYVFIPGDKTFHAGRKPLEDKPHSLSGRGFHYTTDGSYVDVWLWRAAHGGMAGWIDDSHFGPPAQPTTAQLEGKHQYKGGFVPDPGDSPYSLNFEPGAPRGDGDAVQPRRLPKDMQKIHHGMGKIDLHPDHSESEDAHWWLPEADSVAYSEEADAAIPVGTVIPGVIEGSGEYIGDRADIRCAAKWASGHWALEVVRRLDTGSSYDVPIRTGSYMRVAVFDHSQVRHTRHIRPIRIQLNRCGRFGECLPEPDDGYTTLRDTPAGASP